ncbi:MAG: ABC transporter ATP-binding protein [Deltaproteobacteria bacterium]|nr:ABC transporter ATP-binding protein [Deltaproteobacteria bacterium]MBI3076585.1 ABC transporter ATP-binding protein [Deltaproteobacteria bacterium]
MVYERVSKKFFTLPGETRALHEVSLVVSPGEFLAVVGPSGCGKSTLLSITAGLIQPTSGRVLVGGTEVRGVSRRVGYMFQQDHLFEWRTCEQNVTIGLEVQGKHGEETHRFAVSLLEQYGLGAFRQHYPRQLSGGMRQRVALIRTLAVDPEIMLLDEPFSALDYQTRLSLQDDVHSILRQAGKTVVLVTHDISEAISFCDRVVVLSRPPGRVKVDLAIRLTCEKRTPFLARKAPEFNEYFDRIWGEIEITA